MMKTKTAPDPGADAGRARILVVDDHPLVREGLQYLLNRQVDLMCCGEAGTVTDAEAAVSRHKPDLVLLDLRLRNGDGLELIKRLKYQFPGLSILVLSQHDEPMYIERALRAGALGFLAKDHAAEQVLAAIRTVLRREIYLEPDISAQFLQKLVGISARRANTIETLTDRELHVMQLLGSGLSTREIATELHVSFKTIETHRENIKRKLGLNGAAELLAFAIQWVGEKNASGLPSAVAKAES